MKQRHWVIFIAFVSLSLASCGAPSSQEPPKSTVTSSQSMTSSTASSNASTTTSQQLNASTTAVTATTTSTTEPSKTCSEAQPIPSGAVQISSASVDVDGDQRPDSIETYEFGGNFYIAATLSSGGSLNQEIPSVGASGLQFKGVIQGVTPASTPPLVLLQSNIAASGIPFGIWRLYNCTFNQVTDSTNTPIVLVAASSAGPAGTSTFDCAIGPNNSEIINSLLFASGGNGITLSSTSYSYSTATPRTSTVHCF